MRSERWRWAVSALLAAASLGVAGAQSPAPVLDPLDELHFRAPKEKGRAEVVPGKSGGAVRFSFDDDCRGVFFTSPLRGTPEWDHAAGFSFWVKGDGSEHLGGLEFIYDEDYAVRYDYAFPIRGTEWTKVTVAWRDLIPVLPGSKARPLDPVNGNRPSKLSTFWVGKWWYWQDYAAHSFALDDLRLEPSIPLDERDYRPAGDPLARVRAKLKAHQPITVVTMGDSLTDYHHWTNRQVSWPRLLAAQLEAQYGAKVAIENPAIGGTQLRQNLVLLPRWLARAPEPDLVTICFGGNDWEAGMRGPEFEASLKDAIDRIRRATHGKADVLLMTTVPALARWTTATELAEAARKAARERNAGLADTERAFLAQEANREPLFASDKVHMGTAGHELLAKTVLTALAGTEK